MTTSAAARIERCRGYLSTAARTAADCYSCTRRDIRATAADPSATLVQAGLVTLLACAGFTPHECSLSGPGASDKPQSYQLSAPASVRSSGGCKVTAHRQPGQRSWSRVLWDETADGAAVTGPKLSAKYPALPRTWAARLAEAERVGAIQRVGIARTCPIVYVRGTREPAAPMTAAELLARAAPIRAALPRHQRPAALKPAAPPPVEIRHDRPTGEATIAPNCIVTRDVGRVFGAAHRLGLDSGPPQRLFSGAPPGVDPLSGKPWEAAR